MAWMLYGATGYTGGLIARAAARGGLAPVLAGRNAGAVGALAAELGLPHRAFPLAAPDLAGIGLVLHCAGPFSVTGAPMMDACLAARAHYLDITGEIDVFEQAWARDARAKAAGIVLCPGVGFDVIPTDCVAAKLKAALPGAVRLALGFDTRSGLSPGTAKTSVEGLALGGRVRQGGRIVRVPQAWKVRRIDFGDGEKTAMTIGWGDVSTAFHTTGVPNIEVYVAAPAGLIRAARLGGRFGWLLGAAPVQALLKRQAGGVTGPDAATRARQPAFVWGEAQDAAGQRRTARLRTANGYDVTVAGALAVVRHLLGRISEGGTFTPSTLVGADLAERLPGSGPMVLG